MTGSWIGRLLGLGVIALMVVGLAGCVPPNNYVSLGDSYTSGPLIPVQRNDPYGCLRSDHNYASLLAASLTVAAHRDPSCSGATTPDMASPQTLDVGDPNPPQLDSLDTATSVVTLGIGGNDIGFVSIAETCAEKSVAAPTGSPCKAFYTSGGTDQIGARIDATAPKVAAVLAAIHTRAPSAKVFVIGYPDILPEQVTTTSWAACYPVLPIALHDVDWLRDSILKHLNSMLAGQAKAAGAVFVDTYTPSLGHDACQLPTVRWVEPVIPASGAAPVHPNAAGMKGTAATVLTAMKANGIPTR